MEQKYPTREQAQNISTSMCDHEDCDTCEIKRWCCYEDTGRECGASMVAMHDEIDRLTALVPKYETCTWTQEDSWDHSMVWNTECDNASVYGADDPYENGHRFCPYCGKPIALCRATEEAEEPDDNLYLPDDLYEITPERIGELERMTKEIFAE